MSCFLCFFNYESCVLFEIEIDVAGGESKSVQAQHVKVGMFVVVCKADTDVDDINDNDDDKDNDVVEWHRVTNVECRHAFASSLMTIHTLAKNIVVNGVVASCFEKVCFCFCFWFLLLN